MALSIVGRPGSKSVRLIHQDTGIPRYRSNAVAIINYGLAGVKMDAFLRRFPRARKQPFINKYCGRNKFAAVKDAERADIPVPKTYRKLPMLAKASDFLTKRLHSQGGVGIARATGRKCRPTEYFQEYITNRRYELRVHAFAWVPQEEWFLQKRFGAPGEIAWNYHNGGRFQSVKNPNGYQVFLKAKELSAEVLKIRKMAFGAVDLIVTDDGQIYFIEINSAPGFTELSRPIYANAFRQLTAKRDSEILTFANR